MFVATKKMTLVPAPASESQREKVRQIRVCRDKKMIPVPAPDSDPNLRVIRSKAQVCNWVFSGMVADAVDPWIIVSVI